MKTENLVIYRLSAEDFENAILYYLKNVLNQDIKEVTKIEHEYVIETSLGAFEENSTEVFDGLKVICK